MELSQLLVIVIYIFLIVMLFALFQPLLELLIWWLRARKKSFIERADDAHVALYRKRKKMAVENIKDTRIKKLVLLGDEDYYDSQNYARVRGIYWKPEIVECFIQTRRLRPWFWVKIPKELVRDALSTCLRVEANGFEPIGNFAAPIYTKAVKNKRIKVKRKVVTPNPGVTWIEDEIPLAEYYDSLILGHEEYLLLKEKSVEAEELKVHAMIDAVDTRRKAESMITRPEYAPATPGQPDEGPQYDKE